MGVVVWHATMSLDGFITGPDDDHDNPLGVNGRHLHDWLSESGGPGGFRPSDTSGEVFDELFDGFPLSFDRESPESLAERLRWLASLAEGERAKIGRTLRERVAERHSVDTWADGILAAAR